MRTGERLTMMRIRRAVLALWIAAGLWFLRGVISDDDDAADLDQDVLVSELEQVGG